MGKITKIATVILEIILLLGHFLFMAPERVAAASREDLPVFKLLLSPGQATGEPIRLKAAKNEIISLYFQLKGGNLGSIRAENGGNQEVITWKFYQVLKAPKNSPAPDVLIPLAQNLQPSPEARDIWASGRVNTAASAGMHQTDLIFSDGNAAFRQPVHIEVWKFSLPDDLPITILGSIYSNRAWFERYGIKNSEEHDSIIKQYAALMRDYKFNALGSVLNLPVNQIAAGKSVNAFQHFKQSLNYFINTLGYKYFFLPVLPRVSQSNPSYSTYLDKAKKYYGTIADYLKKNQWENHAIVYLWDEPKPQEYPAVKEIYATVKGSAPKLKTMMAGRTPVPLLAEVVDIWVMHANFFDPAAIQMATRSGQQVWLYANKLHGQDVPLVYQRAIGWFLFRYQFPGYFFWGVNYWPHDPWTNPAGAQDYFRRGTLFYPHPKTGAPCPSVRLEAIRQGFQDFLYLQKFAEASNQGKIAPGVYQEINSRVEGITQNLKNVEVKASMKDLEAIRLKIGEALNNL